MATRPRRRSGVFICVERKLAYPTVQAGGSGLSLANAGSPSPTHLPQNVCSVESTSSEIQGSNLLSCRSPIIYKFGFPPFPITQFLNPTLLQLSKSLPTHPYTNSLNFDSISASISTCEICVNPSTNSRIQLIRELEAFFCEISRVCIPCAMKLKLRSRNSRTSSPRGSGRMEESPPLTNPVLVKELTATFRVFDKDGNGKISKEELGEVLCSLGDNVTDCELDEVMANLGGEDGCIDLPQFITFHTNKTPVSRSSETRDAEDEDPEVAALRSAFAVFDTDKNGFISAEELQRVMHTLGDKHTSLEECRHMISSVDRDGNQMVDFSEFRSLMSGTSVLS